MKMSNERLMLEMQLAADVFQPDGTSPTYTDKILHGNSKAVAQQVIEEIIQSSRPNTYKYPNHPYAETFEEDAQDLRDLFERAWNG